MGGAETSNAGHVQKAAAQEDQHRLVVELWDVGRLEKLLDVKELLGGVHGGLEVLRPALGVERVEVHGVRVELADQRPEERSMK